MHDQYNRTGPYGSDRYPSLLIFRSEVALRESVRIIENEHGRFKTNIVLAKVLPILLFIPFKSHRLVATKTEYSLYLMLSIQLYVQSPAAGSIARHGRYENPTLSQPRRCSTSYLPALRVNSALGNGSWARRCRCGVAQSCQWLAGGAMPSLFIL